MSDNSSSKKDLTAEGAAAFLRLLERNANVVESARPNVVSPSGAFKAEEQQLVKFTPKKKAPPVPENNWIVPVLEKKPEIDPDSKKVRNINSARQVRPEEIKDRRGRKPGVKVEKEVKEKPEIDTTVVLEVILTSGLKKTFRAENEAEAKKLAKEMLLEDSNNRVITMTWRTARKEKETTITRDQLLSELPQLKADERIPSRKRGAICTKDRTKMDPKNYWQKCSQDKACFSAG